jgi:hypothetical protein
VIWVHIWGCVSRAVLFYTCLVYLFSLGFEPSIQHMLWRCLGVGRVALSSVERKRDRERNGQWPYSFVFLGL